MVSSQPNLKTRLGVLFRRIGRCPVRISRVKRVFRKKLDRTYKRMFSCLTRKMKKESIEEWKGWAIIISIEETVHP